MSGVGAPSLPAGTVRRNVTVLERLEVGGYYRVSCACGRAFTVPGEALRRPRLSGALVCGPCKSARRGGP